MRDFSAVLVGCVGGSATLALKESRGRLSRRPVTSLIAVFNAQGRGGTSVSRSRRAFLEVSKSRRWRAATGLRFIYSRVGHTLAG